MIKLKTGNFYKKTSVILFVANFFSSVFLGNIFSHYGEYNWAAFSFSILCGTFLCLLIYGLGKIMCQLDVLGHKATGESAQNDTK